MSGPQVHEQERPPALSRLVASVVPALALVSGVAYFACNIDLVSGLSSMNLCPFKLIAQWTCPGCGMMRSIVRLGQLEFARAWELHPFSYPVLLGATAFALRGQLPWQKLHRPLAMTALALLLILWCYRVVFRGG